MMQGTLGNWQKVFKINEPGTCQLPVQTVEKNLLALSKNFCGLLDCEEKTPKLPAQKIQADFMIIL